MYKGEVKVMKILVAIRFTSFRSAVSYKIREPNRPYTTTCILLKQAKMPTQIYIEGTRDMKDIHNNYNGTVNTQSI